MARRSSTINKTRLIEDLRTLKAATDSLSVEIARLDPAHNNWHKMRLQSILGASVVKDIREATEKLNSAFSAVKSIKREILS